MIDVDRIERNIDSGMFTRVNAFEVKTIIAELRLARKERDELQRIFDIMWDADERAIKRWQDAGEGRELVWPDRSKLTEWLLNEHTTACATIEAQKAEIADLRDLCLVKLRSNYIGGSK